MTEFLAQPYQNMIGGAFLLLLSQPRLVGGSSAGGDPRRSGNSEANS